MKTVNEIKTKEDFLKLYEKCWLEDYEPTREFRDEISYLILSGYIQLGYNTMNEISKQLDEIRETVEMLNKIID
mgnify:CR=1 FL=1